MAIWLVVEVFDVSHFVTDPRASTAALWLVVGSSSVWMVYVVTFVPQRIGFALTFCLIVAGKTSGGLFVDAVGLATDVRPVTTKRCAGVFAVFIAALLLKLPHMRGKPEAYVQME